MFNRDNKLRWRKLSLKFWQKHEVKTFNVDNIHDFCIFWLMLFPTLCVFKVIFYLLTGYAVSVAAMMFFMGVVFGLVSRDNFIGLLHIAVGLIGAYICEFIFNGGM
ncbi:MAG: hypothetical protein HRT87_08680 [Legionellales bacterium]|nr:hypothetical protein [Legionellales bacterium]